MGSIQGHARERSHRPGWLKIQPHRRARRSSGRKLPGLLGTLSILAGAGMLVRGIGSGSWKRWLKRRSNGRLVEIHRGLHIDAPVDEVFQFWSRFENFPRFMSGVRDVRDLGRGRSHWLIAGPAGLPLEWDAEITGIDPYRMLAWRTLPGSPVQHTGLVQFTPSSSGGTHLHVRLRYRPPFGALGRSVALLFGPHPEQELDRDLLRMKVLLEMGTPWIEAALRIPDRPPEGRTGPPQIDAPFASVSFL